MGLDCYLIVGLVLLFNCGFGLRKLWVWYCYLNCYLIVGLVLLFNCGFGIVI